MRMKTRSRTQSHPLFRRVAEVIRRNNLIRAGDRVLVAVSGGPDSVCLLTVLTELRDRRFIPGLPLHIAHVNYGLRGEESEKDEGFVRDLGTRLGVPVSCERVRMGLHPGGSLQGRARDIRYAFFAKVLLECGLTTVATGHTADDQAETILLWMLRGSGSKGLGGIPITREGGIIRPLLGVSRSDVLDYLTSRGIPYRMDASNAKALYRRNRIRHELLPLLRSFNPRIVETLAREAEILATDAAALDEVEREQWKDIVIESSPRRVVVSSNRLSAQPLGIRRRLVRRALALVRGRAAGLTFRHVSAVLERLVEGRDGVILNLPGGVRAGRAGDLLTFDHGCEERGAGERATWAAGVPLPVPGEVQFGESRRLLAVAGRDIPLQDRPGQSVVVDADRFGGPLSVRYWRRGDWFCPAGMYGHRKKLQDFFTDLKVPKRLRNAVPLVVAPAGIVWVVGYRGDERFKAEAATTRPITLYVRDGD